MGETFGPLARVRRASPAEIVASPLAWIALALVIALAVLVRDRSTEPDPLPQSFASFYETNASAYAPASVERRDLAAWSFDEGAPKTWTAVGRVFAPRSGEGASVRTGSQPQGYQLVSPATMLEPGTYRILVQGTVDRGGISVGALDPDKEAFLGYSNYWSGQRRPPESVLATAFRVDRPRRVRVTLSNWAPAPSVSLWTIGRVAIQPLPEDASIPRAREVQPDYVPVYQLGASEFVRAGGGTSIVGWTFSPQLPNGWETLFGVRTAIRGGRLDLLTTPHKSAYQLTGPRLRLPAGTFRALVDGKILTGGMMVGVLNARVDAWVATSLYWSGEPPSAAQRMGVEFTLARPTEIRPVLANWAPEPNPSSWRIERFRIVKTSG